MNKTVYLFDIDLIEYKLKTKYPNHALMKLSSYFKNKGYEVILICETKHIPEYKKDIKYIGSSIFSINLERFKYRLNQTNNGRKLLKNIKIGTPFDYCPITDIKGLKNDYDLYNSQSNQIKNRLKYMNYNIGLLTRGCTRKCEFCINKHRKEINRVNNIKDLYQKPNQPIMLLDDNILAYKNYKEVLTEIITFDKENNIKIELKSGYDLRVLQKDKIPLLKELHHVFDILYTAWDNVKNINIFKNIIIYKNEIGNIDCHTIYGVNVNTEEEVKKDLLGLMYRLFQLKKIKVKTGIVIYSDPEFKYNNPFINVYKIVQRNYSSMCLLKSTNIYTRSGLKYNKSIEQLLDIMGEYKYVFTEPIENIINSEDYDDKMIKIAKEIGLKKHYKVTINDNGNYEFDSILIK